MTPRHARSVRQDREAGMRIAIVGAGLGGLTLAAALRQKSDTADVEMYERDASADSRPQGYAIGLKHDGGIAALTDLGLRSAVLDADDTTLVTGFVFTDQRGRELLRLAAGSNETRLTYRVQRRRLKQVLLAAAGGTPVHYGQTCVGYTVSPDGATLRLEGGRTVDADVVVAADGVGSAVRRQFVGDGKHYLGLTAIHADASLVPDHPLLAGGYFMTLGDDGTSFFAYPQPDGTTHFSYTLHAANEAEVVDAPDALLDRVRKGTKGWHDLVGELVAAAKPDSAGVRGYYDREPVRSVRDGARGQVWLIGDAAHPMSPFQGAGANTAMRDALDLADVFAAGTDGAVVAERIITRGRKAALESRRAAAQFHTTSRFKQRNRDFGFRLANRFIRMFNKN
jgi:salicylate hydroxylase